MDEVSTKLATFRQSTQSGESGLDGERRSLFQVLVLERLTDPIGGSDDADAIEASEAGFFDAPVSTGQADDREAPGLEAPPHSDDVGLRVKPLEFGVSKVLQCDCGKEHDRAR